MSIIASLQSDPTGTLIMLLYRTPAILIALTLHELAHGYVAKKCGDPTAQMLGRLTLNPLKHLDPVGTIFMFLFGFGWARPVPINPRNFKHFRRDELLVSLAGVTVNFILFFVTMWIMAVVNELMWKPEIWELGTLTTRTDFLSLEGFNYNAILSNNNLIYVRAIGNEYALYTPGIFQYLRLPWLIYIQRFLMIFSTLNLGLCLFNLLPIPPLDGYHVVNDIFLRGKLHVPARVLQYMLIGLLVLMYFTPFISNILYTAETFIQGSVVKLILSVFGVS